MNIDPTGFLSVRKFDTNEVLFNEWLNHDVYNVEGYGIKIGSLQEKVKFLNCVDKHKVTTYLWNK